MSERAMVSGEKLRHALGVQAYRHKGGLRWSKPYRNHFCPGGDDVALFASMERFGLVRGPRTEPSGWGVKYYIVTEAGAAYALKGLEFKRKWGYGQPANE